MPQNFRELGGTRIVMLGKFCSTMENSLTVLFIFSHLTGLYVKGKTVSYATSMSWEPFRGHYYGLKSSRMMIRVSG